MLLPVLKPTTSFRKMPELEAMFRNAENRHLTPDERADYLKALPAQHIRVAAAAQLSACEQDVVEKIIDEIFAVYPMAPIPHARAKGIRDMRSVSAYATLSMLMNDSYWFRDKLLLWLRTIFQSSNFPDRSTAQKKVLFGTEQSNDLSKLPVNRRVIFEAYNKLRTYYKERLSPQSYEVIEPYLTQALETLVAD